MKPVFLRPLSAAALLAAGAALGADVPLPKVMSDAPPTAGSWRMDAFEGPGAPAAAGGGISLCQTAAQALAQQPGKTAAAEPRCDFRLVEDGATKAVMDTHCAASGRTMRSTITRLAERSYAFSVQDLAKPAEPPRKFRMSWRGECKAGDGLVTFDKDSPACRQARAQAAGLDAARMCGKAGAQRAQCEQMVQQQRAQIEALCR